MKNFFALLFSIAAFFCYSEKIKLPLPAANGTKKIEVEWNEKWFGEESAYLYNHNLARVAAVLSDAAYSDVENKPADNELYSVYLTLGVKSDDMEFHYEIDYDAPIWGNNQAAFSFAVKKINSAEGVRDLVFITIRGTPAVANEWISNIDVSDSTHKAEEIHEGFFYTTEQIHKALIYFLLKKNVNPDNAFFLITGHSRGASVANLLGATMADEEYFDMNHIYDFTFAAPNVSMELKTLDPRYNFIWNIINAEDIVPTVPPNRDNWKYRKFGNIIIIPNAWNTESEKYENDYLPRVNEYFNYLCGRNISPFRTGPFIPIQISRILTGFYGEVAEYYGSIKGLRHIGENMFWSLFPSTTMAPVLDEKEKKNDGNSKIMTALSNKLNESFNGVFDYAAEAFTDMHAIETYLSWTFAMNKDEISTDMGSSQVVIKKSYEAAVFDENGRVVAKVVDGLLQLKSIHLPIAAMPFPRSTVIGFPANSNFTVVVYKSSLIPTVVPTIVEHYDRTGQKISEDEKKYLFPQAFYAYKFNAGKETLESDFIKPTKIFGKELRKMKKETDMNPKLTFRIQPELNFSTDFNFEFGVHLGCPLVYGSILTSQTATKLGNSIELSPGIGHQGCLFDRIYMDFEAYGKCVFATGDVDEGDSRFNFVPSARISLSYKPFHRFQLFMAGCFDFNIEDFNDGAFDSDVRKKNLGKIGLSDTVNVVPALRFGVKF